MRRRVWVAIIIAAVLGTASAIFRLQQPKGDYLPISLKIEWQDSNPKATLGQFASVDTGGTVYVVEQADGRYFYRAFSCHGDTVWRIEAHPDPATGGALVLLPGPNYGHLNCLNWASPDRGGGDIRQVTVNKDGKTSSTLLEEESPARN